MSRSLKREDFLEGMSQAAQTVSVVTTDGPAGRAGVTVSAMCSVSADPPMVLVCIHHQSRAVRAIRKNSAFCVNVLAENMQQIANTFAVTTSAQIMFKIANWEKGITGAPVLINAVASFDCGVEEIHRAGSHFIFIGNVENVALEKGLPLIYGSRSYGCPSYFEKI